MSALSTSPTRRRRVGTRAFVSGAVGLAALAATIPAAVPASAASAGGSLAGTSSAAAAARYLADSLVGSHHDHIDASYVSGHKTITYPAYGETADAVLSMDAAGVAQGAARRATHYLESTAKSYVAASPTDYPGAAANLLLVAEAQHLSPHHFGGVDLVTAITRSEGAGGAAAGEFQQNPGTTGSSYVVSQALGVLALAGSPDAHGEPDAAAVSFLAGQQCSGGGFDAAIRDTPTTTTCTTPDVDSTGYAVQALLAAGDKAAAARGLDWLVSHRHHDGGYGDGATSNANSTALAIQALVMGHRSATDASRWLRAQQVGCGHTSKHWGAVTYTGGRYDGSALFATAQAGAALAHRPLTWVDSAGASSATPRDTCSG